MESVIGLYDEIYNHNKVNKKLILYRGRIDKSDFIFWNYSYFNWTWWSCIRCLSKKSSK